MFDKILKSVLIKPNVSIVCHKNEKSRVFLFHGNYFLGKTFPMRIGKSGFSKRLVWLFYEKILSVPFSPLLYTHIYFSG